MIEYFTIGKIPENCKSSIIYCGDFSSSDTIEFNFSVTPNKIIGLDNDFSCNIEDEVFIPNSKVLSKISEYLRPLGIDLPTNSIYNGFNKCAKTLLKLGANPNVTNWKGTTPLMYAKQLAESKGDTTGLKLLMTYGVKTDKKDMYNKTVFDYLNTKNEYYSLINGILSN